MCAKLIQKLSVIDFLLLGRGEKINEGRKKESIQADLFEALLAAIFLDGGFSHAKDFFWLHFTEEIESQLKEPLRNWKAELQEYSQRKHQTPPVYQVLKEHGPEHSKSFYIAVYLDGVERGRGEGASKKEAEQLAAKEAWMFLEENLE
jgi:ribonuclease-3